MRGWTGAAPFSAVSGALKKLLAVSCGAALLLAASGGLAAAQERYALVIGNGDYANLAELPYPVADAYAIGLRLQEEREFKRVFYAENASAGKLAAAVEAFSAALEAGDIAVVHYAGHAVQLDVSDPASLYLVPVDAPAIDMTAPDAAEQVRAAAISFGELRARIREREPSKTLFLLDASHDNPFPGAADSAAAMPRGVGPIEASEGEFVISSAAPGAGSIGRLSEGDRDPNSVFARTILRHFFAGALLEDVASAVRQEVRNLTLARVGVEQSPWISDGVADETCLDESCGVDSRPALARAAYGEAATSRDPFRLEIVAMEYADTFWGRQAAKDARALRGVSETADQAAPAAPGGELAAADSAAQSDVGAAQQADVAADQAAAAAIQEQAAADGGQIVPDAAAPASAAEAAWEEARKVDDYQAYVAFLEEHGDSAFAEDAKSALRPTYRDAQEKLEALGLYAAGVDGVWGAGSRAAMQRFQIARGIAPADGQIDPATMRALSEASPNFATASIMQADQVGVNGAAASPELGLSADPLVDPARGGGAGRRLSVAAMQGEWVAAGAGRSGRLSLELDVDGADFTASISGFQSSIGNIVHINGQIRENGELATRSTFGSRLKGLALRGRLPNVELYDRRGSGGGERGSDARFDQVVQFAAQRR